MTLVLIYGHQGCIGNKFVECLKAKQIKYVLGKSRVDDEAKLSKEIAEVKPTHVISTIGRTHGPGYKTIDYLEQPGKVKDNVRDNLYAPIILAHLAVKHGFHLTYLGTGCIFTGGYETGFTEDDDPNFFGSSYSIVKGFTDRMMRFMFSDTVLNLRIRMPISSDPSPRNLITKLINYQKICSIPNSMTVLDQLIPIAVEMLLKKPTGTINLINPGLITHNEILGLYRDIVDPNFKWENFTLEEQSKILLAGRSNNHLDSSKLLALYPVSDIHSAMTKVLHQYEEKLA